MAHDDLPTDRKNNQAQDHHCHAGQHVFAGFGDLAETFQVHFFSLQSADVVNFQLTGKLLVDHVYPHNLLRHQWMVFQ